MKTFGAVCAPLPRNRINSRKPARTCTRRPGCRRHCSRNIRCAEIIINNECRGRRRRRRPPSEKNTRFHLWSAAATSPRRRIQCNARANLTSPTPPALSMSAVTTTPVYSNVVMIPFINIYRYYIIIIFFSFFRPPFTKRKKKIILITIKKIIFYHATRHCTHFTVDGGVPGIPSRMYYDNNNVISVHPYTHAHWRRKRSRLVPRATLGRNLKYWNTLIYLNNKCMKHALMLRSVSGFHNQKSARGGSRNHSNNIIILRRVPPITVWRAQCGFPFDRNRAIFSVQQYYTITYGRRKNYSNSIQARAFLQPYIHRYILL